MPIIEYGFSVQDYTEFAKKLEYVLEVIKKDFNFPLLNEVYDGMSFWEKARVMKRKFGDTPEGKEKFKNWLNKLHIEMWGCEFDEDY